MKNGSLVFIAALILIAESVGATPFFKVASTEVSGFDNDSRHPFSACLIKVAMRKIQENDVHRQVLIINPERVGDFASPSTTAHVQFATSVGGGQRFMETLSIRTADPSGIWNRQLAQNQDNDDRVYAYDTTASVMSSMELSRDLGYMRVKFELDISECLN